MKILYVVTGLGLGGAERVVCDLADGMYEQGNEVKIVYLIGEVLTLPAYEDIEVIKLHLNTLGSTLFVYIKLAKMIRKYKPNVVHSHMVHANLLTRMVRLVVPIEKLISTAHNVNEGGRFRMLLYRATHHLADKTTNVSKEAVAAFERKGAVPKGGMSSVYNGIDLHKFRYISGARTELNKEVAINKHCKIILAVGSLCDRKDYANLLQAINLLKKGIGYSLKLLIVGYGYLRSTLEGMVDDFGLQDEVLFLGMRHDIPKLMSAADLFVLPSKYEGFGLVVAEAMACQCLVVATDCGGVAEVLNNAEFLVPPSDAVALKNKIKYALALEGNTKEKVINQNLQHVQRSFSLDSAVKIWIDIYS